MKPSVKSEYAYPALIELSAIYNKDQLRANAEIAGNRDIAQKYPEHVPLALTRRGYVKSYQCPEGNYKHAKPPIRLHMAEIIRLMGEALINVGSVSRYFYQHTLIEKAPKPRAVFRGIGNDISDKPESLSIVNFIEWLFFGNKDYKVNRYTVINK
jgi:DNA-binding IscR family transcriptional regulator